MLKGFEKRRMQSLFFITFILFSASVFAKDAVSLYLENDSRMLKPNHKTDRHYTHGTKFVYLTQPQWQWLEDFSQWHFTEAGLPVETVAGFFLGQNIYAPDHLAEPQKRNDADMPFAGWLYTGLFVQRASHDVLDHLELSVGVIGPSSGAEQMQRYIHDFLDSDEPVGWDEQLKDEFAVDLTYMRKQRLQDGWFKPTKSTDFITEHGFTVGSVHRHFQAGIIFRYGLNLENTFGPARISLPSGISTLRKDKTARTSYFFARATGKAVEHNRFLTGLDHEPLVGEFQVGIVYQYKQLEFGYSQTFFTREFEGQSGKDSIGAVALSWNF